MKIQNEPVMYTCETAELDPVTFLPPVLDDNGVGMSEGDLCELVDDATNTVSGSFLFHGDQWYVY